MFARPLLIASLVLFAGCVAEDPPDPLGSTEQHAAMACTGEQIWNTYYYDANGVEIGSENCNCAGVLTVYGKPRGPATLVLGDVCSWSPNPPGPGGCVRSGGATTNQPPPDC